MRATWGAWYWPTWCIVTLLTLLGPEFYALATNSENTQSAWVWRELDVAVDHHRPWTAVHFLIFGAWVLFMVWLTGHFFYRKWT